MKKHKSNKLFNTFISTILIFCIGLSTEVSSFAQNTNKAPIQIANKYKKKIKHGNIHNNRKNNSNDKYNNNSNKKLISNINKIKVNPLNGIIKMPSTKLSRKNLPDNSCIDDSEHINYQVDRITPSGKEFKDPFVSRFKLRSDLSISVFCIEEGVYISDTYLYTAKTLDEILPDPQLREDITLIAYFGYYSTAQTQLDYITTQLAIWERFGGTTVYHNIPNYENSKSSIMKKVNQYKEKIKPSFNNLTIDLKAGESKTIYDTNNVISKFSKSSSDIIVPQGINATIDGDSITVTANSDAQSGKITINRIDNAYRGVPLAYYAPFYQNVAFLSVEDNDFASLNVRIIGKGKIIKKDDKGNPLPGATFQITNEKTGEKIQATTDENGEIEKEWEIGTKVQIKEINAPFGYLIDSTPQELTISCQEQTASFSDPKETMTTEASSENGKKTLLPTSNVTVSDTISYKNLYTDGRKYKIEGQLVDTNGDPITINGKTVTSENSFRATSSNDSIVIKFTFDASKLNDKTVGFTERLYENDKLLIYENAKGNTDQQVSFDNSSISTTAVSSEKEKKFFDPNSEVTLIDHVKYNNLHTNKDYKVIGNLIDKETGQPLKNGDIPITGEQTFNIGQSGSTSGNIDIKFNFNASKLKGHHIVVYETLLSRDSTGNWYFVTEHKDINDNGQTVEVINPDITTSAINVDKLDGHDTKSFDPLDKINLKDTVSYNNLINGEVYELTGTLMDGNTGKPIRINGNIISATKYFYAGSSKDADKDSKDDSSGDFKPISGQTNVEFKPPINGQALKGKKIVVFESLKRKETEIAKHKNLSDDNQTVYVTNPKITTNATDADNKNKFIDANDNAVIKDTVHYDNLICGQKYSLKGKLVDQATGKKIDEKVESETVPFTAGADDKGKVNPSDIGKIVSGDVKQQVEFKFNTTNMQDKKLVVYEYLYRDGYGDKVLASEEDSNNKDQTIKIINPNITTLAINEEDKSKIFDPVDNVNLTDTISYKKLIKDEVYKVSGILKDENGNDLFPGEKPVDVYFKAENGNAVVVDPTKYTKNNETSTNDNSNPNLVSGTVDVKFNFDASKLNGLKKIVVFEDLYSGKNKVAFHHDLNDKNQTVSVTKPGITTKAINLNDHSSYIDPLDNATIRDTVHYKSLIRGKQYVIRGKLMDKKDKNNPNATPIKESEPIKFTAGGDTSESKVPKIISGDEYVDFKLTADELSKLKLNGHKLVVFEYIDRCRDGQKDFPVATHENFNDKNQTIKVSNPKLKTLAFNKEDKSQLFDPLDKVKLIDTVMYKKLIKGQLYKLTGKLKDESGNDLFPGKPEETKDVYFIAKSGKVKVATPSEIKNARKNNAKTTKKDKIKLVSGSVDVPFKKFNASQLHGKKVIVYEYLYKDDITEPIISHEDLSDTDETVEFTDPSITTTAVNKKDNSKYIDAIQNVTVKDTIHYKNVIRGKKYKIVGKIIDKSKGNKVLKTVSQTFIAGGKYAKKTEPIKIDGDKSVSFTFDANNMQGDKLVVFESLSRNGTKLCDHKDLNDKDQTIDVANPSLKTKALNAEDQTKFFDPLKKVKLTDNVEFYNLIKGKKYMISGKLVDKDGNDLFPGEKSVNVYFKADEGKVKPLDNNNLNVNGNKNGKTSKNVGSSITTVNGNIDMNFEFNASQLHGKSIVAFEKLYRNGINIASHEDPKDQEQTVIVSDPEIKTTAINPDDNTKYIDALKKVKITDNIHYDKLISGKKYKVTGTVMNKKTGKPLLINKKPVKFAKTFTAGKTKNIEYPVSGDVSITFKFNAKNLQGKDLVLFEDLYRNKTKIASESNLDNEDQTIHVVKPKIKTLAVNEEDQSKLFDPLKKVKLTDTVEFKDLIKGKLYKVSGKLMDKKSNKELRINGIVQKEDIYFVANNGKVTPVNPDDYKDQNATIIKPNNPKDNNTIKSLQSSVSISKVLVSGSVDVNFEFNASKLSGKSLVVFEDLYRGATKLATHHNINDKGQTVKVTKPNIKTTAMNGKDHSKYIDSLDKVTISDIIHYKNLIRGKKYTVIGKLMDKITHKPLLIHGKEITSYAVFVAGGDLSKDNDVNKLSTVSGNVDVNFTFDAKGLQGTDIVVFEDLYRDYTKIATHENFNDLDQTVYVTKPDLNTIAVNAEDQSKIFDPLSKVKLTDTVRFTNLIKGKLYKVSGVLMDKKTGKELLIHGKEQHKDVYFIAKEGKVAPLFDSEYNDAITKDNLDNSTVNPNIELVNGTVDVNFNINGVELQGKTVVVYEDLYRKGVNIATHRKINDNWETVIFTNPEILTTAVNNDNNTKFIDPLKEVSIRDTVHYKNLIRGKRYKIESKLMNKSTGEPLLVDGKEITSYTEFTAKGDASKSKKSKLVSGDAVVYFKFDARKLKNIDIVVFESLYRNGDIIAVHKDIDDQGQTVKVNNPDLHTTATSNGKKKVKTSSRVTLKDKVKFDNLSIGKVYTIMGKLMDKRTNKPFLVNGQEVTAKRLFIPKKSSGYITLIYTFDGSNISSDIELVVFEDLFEDNQEVATHEDINDKNQSVVVIPNSGGDTPSDNGGGDNSGGSDSEDEDDYITQTSGDMKIYTTIGLACVVIVATGGYLVFTHKKNKRNKK